MGCALCTCNENGKISIIKKDIINSFRSNNNLTKCSTQNEENYDAIIYINSKKYFNNGWNIKYYGSKEKMEKTKNIIESENEKKIISILGHSKAGKTNILQKITGQNLNPGISTMGINLKIYSEIILLDTVGTNSSLLIGEQLEDPENKALSYYNLIETFVMQYSDILICVVSKLTEYEKQFSNKIKKYCNGEKNIFIIHNLYNCCEKKEIEDYIEKTFKKSNLTQFEEVKIPEFGKKNKELFNKCYKEINHGEEQDIIHFIMSNDKNEDNVEMEYFNSEPIEYLRNTIDIAAKTNSINILDKLTEHIKTIPNQNIPKTNQPKGFNFIKKTDSSNKLIQFLLKLKIINKIMFILPAHDEKIICNEDIQFK